MADEFIPHYLPSSTPSLARGVPPAPAGTLFVLSEQGGYAMPPRRFTLLFGRGSEDGDVHVPVGTDDPYISRCHGRLMCDGERWWLRNAGRLPIRLPADALLLSGQEMPVAPGYLPLLIGRGKRSHLVELRLVGRGPADTRGAPGASTRADPNAYPLDDTERVLLASLAQRYLRGEPHAAPVAWKQVVDDLNLLALPRGNGQPWNERAVANAVARIRASIPDLPSPDELGVPLGNAVNATLIQALLRSATLTPADLARLDGPDG